MGSVVGPVGLVPDPLILAALGGSGNRTPPCGDQPPVKGSIVTDLVSRGHRRRSIGAVVLGSCVGLVLVVLVSCGGGSGSDASGGAQALTIVNPRVDEPVNGTSAAVRMTIDNRGGRADRLLSATADVAKTATFHRSITDAQGRSTMERLDTVPIPTGGQVVFRPGGLHVMLEGLRRPLSVGDEVRLTFRFEQGGTRVVRALVVPIGDGEMTGMDMGGGSHEHAAG